MNIFLLLSRISILLSTVLVAGLPVKAQLSTVEVSGRKLSKAIQRRIQKSGQESAQTLQTEPAANSKGEKEVPSFVQYNYRKPLFYSPLRQIKVTSNWGKRYHPISGLPHFHNGVDLEAYFEPVMAVAAGRVKKVGFDGLSGLFIVLDHGRGITSSYAHLQYALIAVEQLIEGGQVIGVSGNTGKTTAPHLHFAMHLHKMPLNPLKVLQ